MRRTTLYLCRALLAAALALAWAGCAGDSTSASLEPDAGDAAVGPTRGALYAVMVNVAGPEGDTSYLTTIDSLDAGSVLDLDHAIEFPGTANLIGLAGHPAVWITSWDEPTIERWDLTEDGSFERGPTISFAKLGVDNTGYVSESGAFTRKRAAFYSHATGELIQWNPSTMEIIDTLSLEIPDNGAIPPGEGWVQLRPDGSLLVDYYFIDSDWKLGDRVGLKVIDWVANEVIGSDEWVGCNYLGKGSQTSDGTLYYTALAQWVQDSLLWPNEPTSAVPCALRVLPGKTKFDRDFAPTDLGQLIGGKRVTGSLEVLNDELAYFVAWNEKLLPEPLTPENYDDLRYSAPAWKWYTWDLTSDRASEVDSDPFASQPDVLRVDGRLFFRDQRLTAERGGRGITPLYELTAKGTLEDAFIGYGVVAGIAKVRE